MIKFIWTEDAVDLLRNLGSEISTRSIARMLGTTMNAVIGKARRERIPLRDNKTAQASEESRALMSARKSRRVA